MKFQDAVEEIINRLSIFDVVSEYVTLKRQGSNYVGLCPFHNEKTGSFMVSEGKKIYKCFGCGKGGNVITFLKDYLNISYREAVITLAKKANIEIEDDYSSSKQYKEIEEKKKKLYELHKDVANAYYKVLYSDKGKEGLAYLRNRKLSDATIKKFGLGFAPNEYGYMYNLMKEKGYDDVLLFESKLFRLYNDKPIDAFYNRVMFPLVDIYKHVIGFQSRTLDPNAKEQKYVNSLDSIIFHKKSFLYAMNYAYYSKENYYILCEGNMDAITMHQAGFDNAVASMGTAFNENQMFLLKRKPKKVYLCQDTDDAGVKAIINSNKILKSAGIETYVLDLNPVKDADEFINKYGAEAFRKKLNAPIPTLLFIVSSLKKKYKLEDPYEQEKYINEIVTLLADIDNSFVRDNYLKKVAIQENLDTGRLTNLVNKYLKGNTIKVDKELFKRTSEAENEKNELMHAEKSKIDSSFIYLIFLLKDYRDKIKSEVSTDELINEDYRYIYSLYLEGLDISDIYTKLEELDDAKKNRITEIINQNYNYDEENTEKLIESINLIIRQIKIRCAKAESNDSLDSIYELNNKILEINKKKYI